MSQDSSVPSPCVRRCCLDEQDICLGCFRSLGEIVQWSESDDDRRREILAYAERRREARHTRMRSRSDA